MVCDGTIDTAIDNSVCFHIEKRVAQKAGKALRGRVYVYLQRKRIVAHKGVTIEPS